MNSITMLSSLKQIKLRKTNYILTRKWFIKKFARYNNLDVHKFFQQHQTLHTTITQLEIPKEIERKTTDLKHFRDLSKSGPSLKDFLIPEIEISNEPISVPNIPYIQNIDGSGQKGK
ncbi:hypothetical protein WN51_00069 [Melipona quadrifasciata]|uniref:Uncharacterized protein n=1 Tax=Melipona quadrifasciata TaxID=166423 RepID=A0A0M8ZPA3_9HYME|nr:hypothetical protein WN51_00069 [Melipona quadrifasciata]